jgi:urea transport system substrate-binding protein
MKHPRAWVGCTLLAGLALLLPSGADSASKTRPIKVGVLHSLSGTMGISERPLVDAARMAIDEVNARGGVSGRLLVPVVEDGASDGPTFARKAEKLIVKDRVSTLFGCWTSASRKAVLPVVEKHNRLLWYPVQYEGCESSPNVIYTGAAPNQQIIPAVEWCLQHRGNRVFLVGSDYVFPRTANQIVKALLRKRGAACVGEEYRRLGDGDFAAVVAKIRRAKPDVIFNTINGSSNLAFFKALRAAGVGPRQAPVLSVSLAEEELRALDPKLAEGHYCAWNYFMSIDTPANLRFVRAFRKRYGSGRVTDDPIEAAYFQVHLFARAAARAGSTDSGAVRKAARGLIFSAPEGLVRIDPRNQHTWKVARIGQVEQNGQFKIVWSSEEPVRPEPYPDLLFPAGPPARGNAHEGGGP